MIDAKTAVEMAKARASEMLGMRSFNLEEIERTTYKGLDAWDITLSFPPNLTESPLSAISVLSGSLRYKRFLIDPETGDLLAMKLREVATQ